MPYHWPRHAERSPLRQRLAIAVMLAVLGSALVVLVARMIESRW